jgi:hypothetical protein
MQLLALQALHSTECLLITLQSRTRILVVTIGLNHCHCSVPTVHHTHLLYLISVGLKKAA